MKKCYQCGIVMKFIKNDIFLKNILEHNGDGFLIPDRQSSIHRDIYICPKCGIIQQYVPKDELEYLEEL